jgi:hypothetical protein
MSEFYDEFTELMAQHHNCKNEVIVVGDFNFHINKADNTNANKFLEIIDMFDLVQHVTCPTHKDGNTLDLLKTQKDTMVMNHLVDEQNSDHSNILFWLNVGKRPPPKKNIRFRRLKNIDLCSFKLDIRNKFDVLDFTDGPDTKTADYLELLVDTYASSIDVLDNHAPEVKRTVTLRNPTPWTTNDIKEAKVKKRKAEKRWRKLMA